jgi:hypothetical protein
MRGIVVSILVISALFSASCATLKASASPALSGTYIASSTALYMTYTFKGPTVTRYDAIDGAVNCDYSFTSPSVNITSSVTVLPNQANDIWLRDTATGTSHKSTFKYITQNAIIIDGISYFRAK